MRSYCHASPGHAFIRADGRPKECGTVARMGSPAVRPSLSRQIRSSPHDLEQCRHPLPDQTLRPSCDGPESKLQLAFFKRRAEA
jgi:hypothetical protein